MYLRTSTHAYIGTFIKPFYILTCIYPHLLYIHSFIHQRYICAYPYPSINTYIHPCIHPFNFAFIHPYKNKILDKISYTSIHSALSTPKHAYIHTLYLHTSTHAYIGTLIKPFYSLTCTYPHLLYIHSLIHQRFICAYPYPSINT